MFGYSELMVQWDGAIKFCAGKPEYPMTGDAYTDDGDLYVFDGDGWKQVASISTTTSALVTNQFAQSSASSVRQYLGAPEPGPTSEDLDYVRESLGLDGSVEL